MSPRESINIGIEITKKQSQNIWIKKTLRVGGFFKDITQVNCSLYAVM